MSEHLRTPEEMAAYLEAGIEEAGKDQPDYFTYRVTWSDEDKAYIGFCQEFPSLSWLSTTHVDALRGIRSVVADVVADMKASQEAVPEPLSRRK